MHAAVASSPEVLHPLPRSLGFCVVIPHFLSEGECATLIARGEALGFRSANADYPPSYRNNERLVLDDAPLAQQLLARLRPHAPALRISRTGDRSEQTWLLDSINERFRLCRYRPGQAFHLHQDGVHYRSDGRRSMLTFMIYLTDGDAFEGGDTLFFAAGPEQQRSDGEPIPIARVRPRAGSLILFDHHIWHSGAVVTAGVKHIIRSDVLYRCTRPPLEEARSGDAFTPSHRGYVWAMERVAPGVIASAGRDTAIRLWSSEGTALRCLDGHSQSVLGLAALADGRLASVSRDRSLRLWNPVSGVCLSAQQRHHAAVLCVAQAGEHLATGGADGVIQLGETDCRALQGHRGWIWGLIAVDANTLASCSEDADVRLWDVNSGRCLQRLPHPHALRTLALAPDGKVLATGDLTGQVQLWTRLADGWQPAACWQAHAAALRRLRFFTAPAGTYRLASAGEDRQLHLWSLGTDGIALQSSAAHDNFVTDVMQLSAGVYLSCSYDGRIRRHGDGQSLQQI